MAPSRSDSPLLFDTRFTPDFSMERRAKRRGLWPVAGLDEAGRGPLAGPVAAAAVILDPKRIPEGLDDSKRLTAPEREALFAEILANALAVFPGGFGTLDELFEMLTLQQTRKAPPAPIVLFGKSYWSRIINFEALVEDHAIAPQDLDLFEFVDTAEEGWASLLRRGLKAPSDQAMP
ncbi:MAG: LOG family protein [Rhizobiales bacterium]|nr:LOG family protein [Hyphomicrobiales bacterium]